MVGARASFDFSPEKTYSKYFDHSTPSAGGAQLGGAWPAVGYVGASEFSTPFPVICFELQ